MQPQPDNLARCPWCVDHPLMMRYHDTEWGVPVHDERKLYEFLVLDAAQAGLSWRTVLLKRENYRRCFDGFDPQKVSRYTERHMAKLMQDPGIIRNRLKIRSATINARALLKLQEECGSFDRYLWQFVGDKPLVNLFETLSQVPARSPESDAMSKDLKKRGFTFVGSTICYAFMQAAGLVNDHLVHCYRHSEVQRRSP